MVGIKTDRGTIRKLNEDSVGFRETNDYKLYVVADGMGGHNAGEVASKIAVETVINYIENNSYGTDVLEKAVKNANEKVYNLSVNKNGYSGMGTTITAALVKNKKLEVAHVGDSVCFGISRKIEKLTKDHSLVQELIDSGSITEEQGKKHSRKNVITRAIGTEKNVEVDIYNFDIDNYKLYLLCTDGLTNEIEAEEILDIINKTKILEKSINNSMLDIICNELTSLANAKGGRDNITILLFGGEV